MESGQGVPASRAMRAAGRWYAANGQFTDLQAHCADIAKDAGMRMTPSAAWRWLAQGGFSNDVVGQAGIGGLDLAGLKQITQMFIDRPAEWQVARYNVFKLNLHNAEREHLPTYVDGAIRPIACYVRGDRRLPVVGMYEVLINVLQQHSDIESIYKAVSAAASTSVGPQHEAVAVQHAMQALEIMLRDQWVPGRLDKKKPTLSLNTPVEGEHIHSHDPRSDPLLDVR